ncbi:hypothetical protein BDV09DRAFT_188109 [Aspergillus tetrazonus]
MDNHLAAILLTQGAALIRSRPTFFPDPGKLLLEVKAIAINPVDAWQRNNNVLLESSSKPARMSQPARLYQELGLRHSNPTISFQEGAVFLLATLTALSGLTTIDIPLNERFAPTEK